MGRVNWRDHIIVDADLHHGDGCIKGTRIPAATIIGSLADGMTPDEVIAAYPQLTMANVRAALAYAADVMKQELHLPFAS
jgi:uncharacterized protein (DUF433 family)